MAKTTFLALSALLLTLVSCKSDNKPAGDGSAGVPAVPAGEQVVNLYTWADYFTPEVLADFTRATGIKVQVDTYDSNEALMGKLEAGASGYDIIIPSDYTVTILGKRGKLEKIDHAKLSNFANLEESFTHPSYDPGLEFSIPFQWGTSGIGYLADKVTEPVEGWSLLFTQKDAYKGRVSMLKDMREVFAVGLKTRGYSINATDDGQINEALKLLTEQKAWANTLFNSENYKDLLAQGEVWISHGWSSNFAMARYTVNPQIRYIIPKEGSVLWVDNMSIPRAAPHLEQAYQFINYFLDGKPSAAISNSTYGSSPNKAARAFIRPELLADPGLYPPPEVLQRTEFIADVGNATRTYDKAWTELRAQ